MIDPAQPVAWMNQMKAQHKAIVAERDRLQAICADPNADPALSLRASLELGLLAAKAKDFVRQIEEVTELVDAMSAALTTQNGKSDDSA